MSNGRKNPLSLRFVFLMGGLLLWAAEATAHGGFDESIDLSASPDLEAAVVRTAQQYLGTTRLPESFDSVNGKVGVNFDRTAGLAVLVDVLDYGRQGRVRVFGFKDERRVPKGGKVRIASAEANALARKIFEREVSQDKRAELHPLSVRLLAGIYVSKWIRKTRGVPVMGNETFEVGVNGITGEVVYWELGLFDFPADAIDLRLNIQMNEARRRAAKAILARGSPYRISAAYPVTLVVHGREPYYGMEYASEKSRDRLYVAVDGRTGEVKIAPRNEEFEEVARASRQRTNETSSGGKAPSSLGDLAVRLDRLAVRDARVVIESTRAGTPTLILFADRHCYTCLRMIEVFSNLRERAPQGAALFLVDPQRADPATALLLTRYRVWVTPTTVLVDRTGRTVRTLHGYYELPALLQELDRLLVTPRAGEPRHDRPRPD